MNLVAFDLIIFIVGGAVGLAAGLYFKKSKKHTQTTTTDGTSVNTLQQDIDKKQVVIDSFFEDANDALTQTERLVARLRNQLAAGAAELSATKVPATNKIDKIENPTESSLAIEPPRDYALKEDTDSPGTLSEEFGFSQEQTKEKTDTPPTP